MKSNPLALKDQQDLLSFELENIGERIKDHLQLDIHLVADQIAASLLEVHNGIWSEQEELLSDIKLTLAEVDETLQGAQEETKSKLDTALDWIKDKLSAAQESISETVSSIAGKVTQEVGDITVGLATKLANAIPSLWRKAVEGTKDLLSDIIRFPLELLLDLIGRGIAKASTSIIDKMLEREELPPEVRELLEAAKKGGGQWQLFLAQSVGGTAIGGTTGSFLNVLLRGLTQALNRMMPTEIPDAGTITEARRRELIDPQLHDHAIRSLGFDPKWQEVFSKLQRQLFGLALLRELELREEFKPEEIDERLKLLGWHKDDIPKLKAIWWVVPPYSDLIRFAVREVYRPEVAERYMLFEELEPVWGMLEKDAKAAGLNYDTFRKYWAAHWELPSITQGFEMLHRGKIEPKDLDDLMRALDIAPYWRGKLKEISYIPITRVDLRRMWDVRSIDPQRLKRGYQDIGYSEEDAELMTRWTFVYTGLPDLLSRFKNAWISEEEVLKQLLEWGIPEDRAREMLESKIKAPYKPERTARERDLTKSEIIKGVKKGLITREEGSTLLTDLGYDPGEADFILELHLGVEGSPETYVDFKRLTQLYKRALGLAFKEIPKELLELDQKIKAVRQEIREAEERKAPEEELHRLRLELDKLITTYNRLLAYLNL